MTQFSLPTHLPQASCRQGQNSAARSAPRAEDSTLRHLYKEAKLMGSDVWQTISTPRQSFRACWPETKAIWDTLYEDKEYKRNICGRLFNQVGGGLSHGGFLALLSHTSAVSAAGGLLASTSISFFEERVAGMAQVHRGIMRDLARQSTHSEEEASDLIKSRAASRLILLGAMDAGVMACALGVVWCVSAGLLSSGGLLLALAAMQTVRTAIVIYQFACIDILKVQIKKEEVRGIINRKWTNAINNSEQGVGRTLYHVTLIACQTATFFMPPAWKLSFTAAQIGVGMALSAAGKLVFLPVIKVDTAKTSQASKVS